MSPDNPIKDASEDLLGRSRVAESFAQHLLNQDASNGLVVGVLGKWGSGKTSFLNLMRPTFRVAEIPIVDFNPWLFSGVEQLADIFLNELGAQLKLKTGFADVTKAIEEYGETLSDVARLPIIGGWYGVGLGAAKAINKVIRRRKGGVQPVREKVRNALGVLDKPIAVVVDDVDRLSSAEIRDLFKLVRLTASFPNVVYLVAFDRIRVESALSEDGTRGRDYLEKILQMAIDLPFVPNAQLQQQIFESIDRELKDIPVVTTLNQQSWPNIFFEIIRPLVSNMRDVRRYVSSLRWVVESLDGKISLGDVLALEAVRIFLPDLFYRLPEISHDLTETDTDRASDSRKNRIEAFLESAGQRREVAESLIKRLFPAAEHFIGGSHYDQEWQKSWLKDKRVASTELLLFYLERVAGDSLVAFGYAEKAWAVLADESELSRLFESVPAAEREALIQSLEAYESDFRAEHVVPASIVLLNTIPSIPDRPRGFLEFDAEMTIGRVVYRLLRALDDGNAVSRSVGQILPRLNFLTQKIQLINMVGDREGVGHNMVTEEDVRLFEAKWREELESAAPEDLAKETDLLRVFYEGSRHIGEGDRLNIPADPRVTHAMLRSARSETKVQSGDSPVIERRPRLTWDVLAEVYGGENVLLERIEGLKMSGEQVDADLLELAEKYASGWRPKDFGEY